MKEGQLTPSRGINSSPSNKTEGSRGKRIKSRTVTFSFIKNDIICVKSDDLYYM